MPVDMPKPRHRQARAPQTIDDAVSELGTIVQQDPSTRREVPVSREQQEEAALPAQRAVYEKIMGKKVARRDRQQADERAHLTDLPEEEEGEASEEEELDADDGSETTDDRGDDAEEDDQPREHRRPPKRVARAIDTLRRAQVPNWVFDQDEEKLVELADRIGSTQASTKDAIR